jgi:hypothetical protein
MLTYDVKKKKAVGGACLQMHRLLEKKKEALLSQIEKEEEARVHELALARRSSADGC